MGWALCGSVYISAIGEFPIVFFFSLYRHIQFRDLLDFDRVFLVISQFLNQSKCKLKLQMCISAILKFHCFNIQAWIYAHNFIRISFFEVELRQIGSSHSPNA